MKLIQDVQKKTLKQFWNFKMANTTNLQDTYLNKLRKEKVFLTVILMNGFQLRGVIKSFDNFTVLIETDGKQQLIFKHAISTFAPSKNVDLDS